MSIKTINITDKISNRDAELISEIEIQGTITIDDEISKFSISNDIYDSWHQWGASQERLSKSMFIVERLYEQIISEYGSHDDMEEIDNES